MRDLVKETEELRLKFLNFSDDEFLHIAIGYFYQSGRMDVQSQGDVIKEGCGVKLAAN